MSVATIMMRARKSLGQHFLMHARIAERIALSAQLTSESLVLEVGPGTGVLTRELLKLAKRVIAVEADERLYKKLRSDFAQEIAQNKLMLVHDDIRNYPLNSAIAEDDEYSVVANIPYYLTGELLRFFLSAEHQPSSMTLLVQKEVAERIAVRKKKLPDLSYGKESILSLSVKAYGVPKYEFTVRRGAFIPAPKVDSAVLTIRDISRKNFRTKEEEGRFFSLIRAGFAHKRKFVRNNLISAGFNQEDFDIIPSKSRAEDVPFSVWIELSAMHTF